MLSNKPSKVVIAKNLVVKKNTANVFKIIFHALICADVMDATTAKNDVLFI